MGSGVGGGMAEGRPKAATDSKEAERCYMRCYQATGTNGIYRALKLTDLD